MDLGERGHCGYLWYYGTVPVHGLFGDEMGGCEQMMRFWVVLEGIINGLLSSSGIRAYASWSGSLGIPPSSN